MGNQIDAANGEDVGVCFTFDFLAKQDQPGHENAEFIVTACNSYYTNKAAIAELVDALEWISSLQYKDRNTVTPDNAFEAFGQQNKMVVDIFKKADALISKHKAGE